MADAVLDPPSRRGSIGVRLLVSSFMTNPFVLPHSTFAIGVTYFDSVAMELVMVTSGTSAS
ncbi:MAG: hypothetical protein K0Q46_6661, partial [Rhodococcus erythropolis]